MYNIIKDENIIKINSTETGKLLQVLPHIHKCDKKLFYPPLLRKSSVSYISRNIPTCYINLKVYNHFTKVLMKKNPLNFL